jgi:hypothetical protein
VVLVPVGQDDPPDAFLILYKIGDIRYNEIDSEHFLVRKLESRIDDKDVVAVLEHEHVFPDFPESA